ncbi:hypothetical protein ACL9RI_25480 [Janthinobacterium sp. Mn2066]|uniref:hypothetical protein n=1 Tax=Janthinobacterium sp. Mn2066 TaxID=3395264 RepID=UPI003BC8C905
MSDTIYYKTITISTGSFVQIELAVRLEIANLERITEAGVAGVSLERLASLRIALAEFSA